MLLVQAFNKGRLPWQKSWEKPGIVGVLDPHNNAIIRGGIACSWLICSPLAAFAGALGFGYGLFTQSSTKSFDANSTDEDIEAFCISPAAMAYTCIAIDQNGNVTNRTLVAIGRCFWLTKISIISCKKMDGES